MCTQLEITEQNIKQHFAGSFSSKQTRELHLWSGSGGYVKGMSRQAKIFYFVISDTKIASLEYSQRQCQARKQSNLLHTRT